MEAENQTSLDRPLLIDLRASLYRLISLCQIQWSRSPTCISDLYGASSQPINSPSMVQIDARGRAGGLPLAYHPSSQCVGPAWTHVIPPLATQASPCGQGDSTMDLPHHFDRQVTTSPESISSSNHLGPLLDQRPRRVRRLGQEFQLGLKPISSSTSRVPCGKGNIPMVFFEVFPSQLDQDFHIVLHRSMTCRPDPTTMGLFTKTLHLPCISPPFECVHNFI